MKIDEKICKTWHMRLQSRGISQTAFVHNVP